MINFNGVKKTERTSKSKKVNLNEVIANNKLLLMVSYKPDVNAKTKQYKFEVNSEVLNHSKVFENNDLKKTKVFFGSKDDGTIMIGFISKASLTLLPDDKSYKVLLRSNNTFKSSKLFNTLEEMERRLPAKEVYYKLTPITEVVNGIQLEMYELSVIKKDEIYANSKQLSIELEGHNTETVNVNTETGSLNIEM